MGLSKKDATQIIKKYLESTELNSRIRWDEAAKLLGPDAPHEALEVLSTGEKRQLWSEYQSQSKKRKRERERQTKSESINVCQSSINDWVLENQGCNRILLFRDFANEHHKSAWWNNIEDKEKDEMFHEVVEESEKRFLGSLESDYEENVKLVLELFKQDSEIFPSFESNTATCPISKDGEYSVSRGSFSGARIWESIKKKYEKEKLFNKVYNRDIVNAYTQLLKEKMSDYRKESSKRELKLRRYRMMFWDIVCNDILSGKISPVTRSRKSYFFTNSKVMDENIEDLCKAVSKRVKHKRSVSYFEYFEDFLKFIGFHLSIKKDQKVILALLKHPVSGGANLYCTDMFEYIVYLLQKLYEVIISESHIYFKSSEKVQLSFQQYKEIAYENKNILGFKTKYVFPFSFEPVLDTVLYRAYCDEFGHYSLGSSRSSGGKANNLGCPKSS